jgi:hypothetical protein
MEREKRPRAAWRWRLGLLLLLLGGVVSARAQAPFPESAFVVAQDGSGWLVSVGIRYQLALITDSEDLLPALPEGPEVRTLTELLAVLATITPAGPSPFPEGSFVIGRDQLPWVASHGYRFPLVLQPDTDNLIPRLPQGRTAATVADLPGAQPPPREQLLTGGTGVSVLGCIPCDGQARFMGPGQLGVSLGLGIGNPGEARVAVPLSAGTLRHLRVQVGAADGGIWSFGIWVNGAPAALGCTINGRTTSGQTSCDSGEATLAIEEGDRVSLGVGNPGDPFTQGNFTVDWSLEWVRR